MREMRYSDSELGIIKNTFCENDELLKATRKAMYQLPLTPTEEKLVRDTYSSEELIKLMKKIFIPSLTDSYPLGDVFDLYMALQVADKDENEALIEIAGRDRMICLLKEGLENIQDPVRQSDIISSYRNTNDRSSLIELKARNGFIVQVDKLLVTLKILAGQRNESVEEIKKKLAQDSSE